MKELACLVVAALLEVGGDALVRWGLRSGRVVGFILGAVVLFSYGLSVNVPRWDFNRLMGVYIAVVFVVAQAVSVLAFREPLRLPILVGGAFVVLGGLIMTLWKTA